MRQVGVLAAAGLVGLEKMASRLGEDHDNARWLAEKLAEIEGISIDPDEVRTNILFFDVNGLGMSNKEFCGKCADKGVRFSAVGTSVRAVTHVDVSSDNIETALEIVKSIANDR